MRSERWYLAVLSLALCTTTSRVTADKQQLSGGETGGEAWRGALDDKQSWSWSERGGDAFREALSTQKREKALRVPAPSLFLPSSREVSKAESCDGTQWLCEGGSLYLDYGCTDDGCGFCGSRVNVPSYEVPCASSDLPVRLTCEKAGSNNFLSVYRCQVESSGAVTEIFSSTLTDGALCNGCAFGSDDGDDEDDYYDDNGYYYGYYDTVTGSDEDDEVDCDTRTQWRCDAGVVYLDVDCDSTCGACDNVRARLPQYDIECATGDNLVGFNIRCSGKGALQFWECDGLNENLEFSSGQGSLCNRDESCPGDDDDDDNNAQECVPSTWYCSGGGIFYGQDCDGDCGGECSSTSSQEGPGEACSESGLAVRFNCIAGDSLEIYECQANGGETLAFTNANGRICDLCGDDADEDDESGPAAINPCLDSSAFLPAAPYRLMCDDEVVCDSTRPNESCMDSAGREFTCSAGETSIERSCGAGDPVREIALADGTSAVRMMCQNKETELAGIAASCCSDALSLCDSRVVPAPTRSPTVVKPTAKPTANEEQEEDDDGPCGDSATWHKKNAPTKDCPWVAGFPEQRCASKDEVGIFAFEECQTTCGGCGVVCADSPTWHKAGESEKGCTWAGRLSNRLLVVGEDGSMAFNSCLAAAANCEAGLAQSCGDSSTWHKKNDPSKGCNWVSSQTETRCLVKDDNAVFAFETCRRSCGGCDEEKCRDSKSWHKKDESVKDCDWVSRFSPRLLVVGEDGSLGFEACRKAARHCDF